MLLHGLQSDDSGDHSAGTFILIPQGSAHRVWSDGGCVVQIQWIRAAAFV